MLNKKGATEVSDDGLPIDILRFIAKYIRSIAHLEILLFLFENRERSWPVEELSRAMRTNDPMAARQLAELASIIEEDKNHWGSFKFTTGSSQAFEIVQRLSELYRSRRMAVINAIYPQSNASIRSFADAFKLKKDD